MDDNWIVENLENALATWNEKLAEIWQLVSMTPQEFKGGGIWNIVVQINGALQAIGYGLLVLVAARAVQKHGELSGAAPPGGGFAVFPAFCGGKSRRHLLYAADAGRVRYMRRHCKHGGRADGRYGGQRGPSHCPSRCGSRSQRGHPDRQRGFSRVHPMLCQRLGETWI